MATVKNSLTKPKKTFSAFLSQDAMKRKINEIVGGEKGQQFITAIISAVSTNPQLAECDHSSILSAALLGQSLGLTPSPQLGQYYLVPFNDKKRGCKIAQFQLGYKGYVQLAIRSGYYKKINVIAIKEGELVKYNPLEEEIEVNLIEDDEIREQTPTVGYFAMFSYQNGFVKTMYWSKKKMLAHADRYSMAFNAESYKKLQDGKIPANELWKYSSFWYKDFDGMAYKTMLRQLISKWGIMSIEMQEAYSKDMAEIKENGDYEYIDSVDTEDIIEQTEETEQHDTEVNSTEQNSATIDEEMQKEAIAFAQAENDEEFTEDDFFNN